MWRQQQYIQLSQVLQQSIDNDNDAYTSKSAPIVTAVAGSLFVIAKNGILRFISSKPPFETKFVIQSLNDTIIEVHYNRILKCLVTLETRTQNMVGDDGITGRLEWPMRVCLLYYSIDDAIDDENASDTRVTELPVYMCSEDDADLKQWGGPATVCVCEHSGRVYTATRVSITIWHCTDADTMTLEPIVTLNTPMIITSLRVYDEYVVYASDTDVRVIRVAMQQHQQSKAYDDCVDIMFDSMGSPITVAHATIVSTLPTVESTDTDAARRQRYAFVRDTVMSDAAHTLNVYTNTVYRVVQCQLLLQRRFVSPDRIVRVHVLPSHPATTVVMNANDDDDASWYSGAVMNIEAVPTMVLVCTSHQGFLYSINPHEWTKSPCCRVFEFTEDTRDGDDELLDMHVSLPFLYALTRRRMCVYSCAVRNPVGISLAHMRTSHTYPLLSVQSIVCDGSSSATTDPHAISLPANIRITGVVACGESVVLIPSTVSISQPSVAMIADTQQLSHGLMQSQRRLLGLSHVSPLQLYDTMHACVRADNALSLGLDIQHWFAAHLQSTMNDDDDDSITMLMRSMLPHTYRQLAGHILAYMHENKSDDDDAIDEFARCVAYSSITLSEMIALCTDGGGGVDDGLELVLDTFPSSTRANILTQYLHVILSDPSDECVHTLHTDRDTSAAVMSHLYTHDATNYAAHILQSCIIWSPVVSADECAQHLECVHEGAKSMNEWSPLVLLAYALMLLVCERVEKAYSVFEVLGPDRLHHFLGANPKFLTEWHGDCGLRRYLLRYRPWLLLSLLVDATIARHMTVDDALMVLCVYDDDDDDDGEEDIQLPGGGGGHFKYRPLLRHRATTNTSKSSTLNECEQCILHLCFLEAVAIVEMHHSTHSNSGSGSNDGDADYECGCADQSVCADAAMRVNHHLLCAYTQQVSIGLSLEQCLAGVSDDHRKNFIQWQRTRLWPDTALPHWMRQMCDSCELVTTATILPHAQSLVIGRVLPVDPVMVFKVVQSFAQHRRALLLENRVSSAAQDWNSPHREREWRIIHLSLQLAVLPRMNRLIDAFTILVAECPFACYGYCREYVEDEWVNVLRVLWTQVEVDERMQIHGDDAGPMVAANRQARMDNLNAILSYLCGELSFDEWLATIPNTVNIFRILPFIEKSLCIQRDRSEFHDIMASRLLR